MNVLVVILWNSATFVVLLPTTSKMYPCYAEVSLASPTSLPLIFGSQSFAEFPFLFNYRLFMYYIVLMTKWNCVHYVNLMLLVGINCNLNVPLLLPGSLKLYCTQNFDCVNIRIQILLSINCCNCFLRDTTHYYYNTVSQERKEWTRIITYYRYFFAGLKKMSDQFMYFAFQSSLL